MSDEAHEDIHTSRLHLRPLQATDAAELFQNIYSQEIPIPAPTHHKWSTANAIRGVLANEILASPRRYAFAIHIKSPHEAQPEASLEISHGPNKASPIVGMIALRHPDLNGLITYSFTRNVWNQGYCTEALKVFTSELLARQVERDELNAMVLEHNMASRKVLEKSGFVLEGRGRERDLEEDEEVDLKKAVEALTRAAGTSGSEETRTRRWKYVEYRYERARIGGL